MYHSALWRIVALLLLFGSTALYTPAQDASQQPSGDPVADAARKARAAQKNEPKPKKVFTNDDIPSAAVSSPAPTPAENSQASGTQGTETITGKKETDKDKDKPKDTKGETYWRARFRETRKKLADAQQELDILQRELNKDQVQYYKDPQQALMQQNNRNDINEKTAKVDAKKKEIEALNQKLSDMEDELRKAGGDPGWAR